MRPNRIRKASVRSDNDIFQDFLRFSDPERPKKDVWFPNPDDERWREECCDEHSKDLDFFVPESQLREYFSRNLNEILCAVSEETGTRPVESRLVRNGYLKIFAILLRINRGNFIRYFVKYDTLNDNKLPFERKPHDFPPETVDDPTFWTNFNDCQWMFCAPEIRYMSGFKWGERRVLPIVFKKPIGSGGSADTFMIRIHPDYNFLDTKIQSNALNRTVDKHTFVLKTFRSQRARDLYRKEREANEKVHGSFDGRYETGIIGYYGSFEHRNTFHIILEYANRCTLEHYLDTVPQPIEAEDTYSFWENILVLIRALEAIHTAIYYGGGVNVVEKGWHQDIKPANILCQLEDGQSPYNCRFKLADLGLSHFVADSEETALSFDTRGTRTYGAPEAYRTCDATDRRFRLVSQKVDVWSLGCILAEAAVWVVKGQLGLENFRNQREHVNPSSRDTGCFHNGLQVLPLVNRTLEDLHKTRRCGDRLTGELIPLIQKMLWRETARPVARDVWVEAKSILDGARRALETSPKSPCSPDGTSAIWTWSQQPPDRKPSLPLPRWLGSLQDVYGESGVLMTEPITERPSPSPTHEKLPSPPSSHSTPPTATNVETCSAPNGESSGARLRSSAESDSHPFQSTMEVTELPDSTGVAMMSSRKESIFPVIQHSPNDINALRQCIKANADVNELNELRQTPIMVAAINRNFQFVEMLLNKVRLDLKDRRKETLLHHVLAEDGEETLDKILRHVRSNSGDNLDVNAANIDRQTPLHIAVRSDRYRAMELLIKHGADVDARDSRGTLPSTIAIEGNKVNALRILIKHNCNIDMENINRRNISPNITWILEKR